MNNMFESLKKTTKDAVDRVIGKESSIAFRHEVERKTPEGDLVPAKKERAEKRALIGLLQEMHLDIKKGGVISHEDTHLKMFIAGIHELFTPAAIALMKENAPEAAHLISDFVPTEEAMRTLAMSIEKKYGVTVNEAAIADILEESAVIKELGAKLANSIFQNLPTHDTVQKFIASDKDASASVGRILEGEEAIARHENAYMRDKAYRDQLEVIAQQTKNSVIEMVYQAPIDFAHMLWSKEKTAAYVSFDKTPFVQAFSRALALFGNKKTEHRSLRKTLSATLSQQHAKKLT